MYITMIIIITALSALAGRAHGGGWDLGWDRVLAKLWLGGIIGVANFLLFDTWLITILSIIVTISAFSTGHGRVWLMQGIQPPKQEPELLETLFGSFWKGKIDQPAYSWFIMGLKGLFIALPIAPLGFLVYFLWPLSYYISFKYYKTNEIAEWLSCGIVGFLAAITIAYQLLIGA